MTANKLSQPPITPPACLSMSSLRGMDISSSATDFRSNGDSFNISDSGWTSKHPNISWEWGLQAGFTLLALQTLDQCGFLSADVSSSTTVHVHVEIISRSTSILPDQTVLVSLVDGELHVRCFIIELSPDIDVCCSCSHSSTCHQAAFYKLVRVVSHDLTIFACTRFSFISVYNQVFWSTIRWFVHKTPFQTTGETCTTSSPESRCFDFGEDPVVSFQNDLFRFVPVTPCHCSLEFPVMPSIQIGEYSVVVMKGTICFLRCCFG